MHLAVSEPPFLLILRSPTDAKIGIMDAESIPILSVEKKGVTERSLICVDEFFRPSNECVAELFRLKSVR